MRRNFCRDMYLYNGKAELVLKRDDFKCVKCGMSDQDHFKKYGRGLIVHHKDGKGYCVRKGKKNNDISNLETLCCKCHGLEGSCKFRLSNVPVRENSKWMRYNFFISNEMRDKLGTVAAVKNTTSSRIVRELIEKYIQKELPKITNG